MRFGLNGFSRWAATLAVLLSVAAGSPADPIAPMHGFHEWVAGYGDGYVDGPFYQAKFRDPQGLIYDAKADRLLVADRGNGCIRTVALGRQNEVGTLGKGDGPDLSALRLVSPTALVWVDPGNKFAVLDPATPELAVVDLSSGTVTAVSGAGDGTMASYLARARDVIATDHGLLLSIEKPSQIAYFSLENGGLRFVKAWTVDGIPPTQGLGSISLAGGKLLGILQVEGGGQIFELLDEAKGPAGARLLGGAAALPLSLTASPVGTGDLASPWAFVRDGEPTEMVTRSPYLGAKLNFAVNPVGIWKAGVYDKYDRMIGTQDDQFWIKQSYGSKDFKSVGSDPFNTARIWVAKAAAAASDESTRTWYISDPEDGRIVSFRPLHTDERTVWGTDANGFQEWDYPLARRPDTTRMVVFNLCKFMSPADTMRRADTYSKRLEHYLNTMSAMDGSPRSFEVLNEGSPWSWEPPGFSTIGLARQRWDTMEKKVAPDRVILAIEPMIIYEILLDYRFLAADADGLPSLDFDPEFAAQPKESLLGKDYVAFLRELKAEGITANSALVVNGKGILEMHHYHELATEEVLSRPALFKLANRMLHANLADLARRVAASKATAHPLALTVLYWPGCTGISLEENAYITPLASEQMEKVMADYCKEFGFDFLEIVPEVRAFAAEDPMANANTLHPNAQGLDDWAFATAWRMLQHWDGWHSDYTPAAKP